MSATDSPSEIPAAAARPVASPASVRALELDALLAMIAELAATDLGRALALELAPAAAEDDLAARRRRYEEARRLLAGPPLVAGFDFSAAELLARLRSPHEGLSGVDLVRLADLLHAAGAAAERVRTAEPPGPELAAEVAGLADLSALLARLGGALDRRGDVREDASPLLSDLRRRIRSTRDRLYGRLSGYVERHRAELSEETVPMREGRLVLVLQAGSRGRVRGLTHGRSATGKSFYFEPLEAVEENNTLQQAVEDEEAERRRILLELAGEARRVLPEIAAQVGFLARLDLLQAAVRFAERCDGRLAEPAPAGRLALRGARHPLLVPELAELREAALGHLGHRGEAVPLELDLGGEPGARANAPPPTRALVVTGPNAGGKTVALKTVGLLALAAQCGLPVPAAAGTRLPFLRSVVATVGDEQDLLADRSTFSGRLLRLKEAWEGAGPESLVLLDELGSGTDPEEGAALAISLLEGLLERRSLAVVTTHLTQVAAAALELPGAACAAMEFSAATGEPTYRLLPGPPGASEALALGRRLGLPAQWLDRAEARLGSEHLELRRMLAEVERVRRELADAQVRAEREAARLAAERAGVAAEREALAAERRGAAKALRGELDAFRQETRRRFREEVERIVAEVEAGRRRGLAAAATERAFAAAPAFAEAAAEAAGPLAVGARVRHRSFGWEGELESLDRGRAEVRVAGKRFRCREEDLAPAAETGAAPGAGARAGRGPFGQRGGATGGAGDLEAARTGAEAPAELHLLGERVEPALERLDEYLDRALLASRGEVRVVHGHGTGQLRSAVREHLRGHPAVASHRPGGPEEGGNGATVVVLKGD
jgi:DNA mismatch repair protein MutS2